MTVTSLARQWVDRALGGAVIAAARKQAEAAINACPDTPIVDAEDAQARRVAWDSLANAIADTEAAAKPIKDRIGELRKELAAGMSQILARAIDRRDSVRKFLGAWDAARAEDARLAEQQEKARAAREALARVTKQQEDENLRRRAEGRAARGEPAELDFGPTSEPEPEPEPPGPDWVKPAAPKIAHPFDANPTRDSQPAPPPPAPTGPTRKATVIDIVAPESVRLAIMAGKLPPVWRVALHLHEPTIKKLVRKHGVPEALDLLITVSEEPRAVRSRRKQDGTS